MTRVAGARAAVLGAVALALVGGAAHAQDAGRPDAGVATPTADEARAKAETQVAAAQQTAASLEAQVIDLRRSLEVLQRERAAFEDIRARLDQLDARLAEEQGRTLEGAKVGPIEGRAVRFRDDGVVIRSPDNRFLLRPRVRLQVLYTGEVASKGQADSASLDRSSFSLAHAEVILEGHAVSPDFEYRLQLDAAKPPPNFQPILDAFVQWRATGSVALRAGQFKVPYGLQSQYWTADLEFVDVSAPTAAFAPGWDLGLMLVGRPLAGRLQYEVAVLNGAGPGLPNDNFDLAYAARVVAAPFGPLPPSEGDIEGHAGPLVSGGLSGFYNLVPTDILARDPTATIASTDVNNDGRIDNVAVWQGGVELRAIWRGAALQAEWFSRLEDPGAASPTRSFWGAYAQASYFVIPHRLLVGARIGQTELPLYGIEDAERKRLGKRVNEQSAVVSAYLRGSRAKLQVDYSHLAATDAASAPDVNRVRAAVQLGF